MAKRKLTSIVEGFLIDAPIYNLEGLPVGLSGDGQGKWQATTIIDIQGQLDVFLHVVGPRGTAFKLTILCAETGETVYECDDQTNPKGFFMLLDDTACGCSEVA